MMLHELTLVALAWQQGGFYIPIACRGLHITKLTLESRVVSSL